MIELFIPGNPATAGSKKGFPIRRKDGSIGVSIVHDNKRVGRWMRTVARLARKSIKAPLEGPVKLSCTFYLPRPKNHFSTNGEIKPRFLELPHLIKPDLTKLVRAVEDGLKKVAWHDDSQVVLQANLKLYADSVSQVGVQVRISSFGGT